MRVQFDHCIFGSNETVSEGIFVPGECNSERQMNEADVNGLGFSWDHPKTEKKTSGSPL